MTHKKSHTQLQLTISSSTPLCTDFSQAVQLLKLFYSGLYVRKGHHVHQAHFIWWPEATIARHRIWLDMQRQSTKFRIEEYAQESQNKIDMQGYSSGSKVIIAITALDCIVACDNLWWIKGSTLQNELGKLWNRHSISFAIDGKNLHICSVHAAYWIHIWAKQLGQLENYVFLSINMVLLSISLPARLHMYYNLLESSESWSNIKRDQTTFPHWIMVWMGSSLNLWGWGWPLI